MQYEIAAGACRVGRGVGETRSVSEKNVERRVNGDVREVAANLLQERGNCTRQTLKATTVRCLNHGTFQHAPNTRVLHTRHDDYLFRHTTAELQNRAVARNRQVFRWGYLVRHVADGG